MLCLIAMSASTAVHGQAQSITSLTAVHPRLWITPARMARMQVSRANNTIRWQNLITAANTVLATPNDTNPEDIAAPALVYQVTGKTQYATKAISIIMANAQGTSILTNDGFDYRLNYRDVALGLDWCYKLMTVAQRHTVATWLMDMADYVWPDTNPSRVGAWGVDDPGDNYYYGFLMTWIAGIASYGDDTGVGAISGKNRPLYHINLGISKWNTQVVPYLNSLGVGGLFLESTNYDSTNFLAQILDGQRTATGQDLINNGGTPFLRDSVYWRIYSTVPTANWDYPLGEQTRVPSAPLCDWDRQRDYQVYPDLSEPTAAGYGKYWLDNLNPFQGQAFWSWNTAWEFLFYNENAASTNYTATLPTDYFASGAGFLSQRSDWAPSATYFGIWSGPLVESHQDFDVNGFEIYKGDNWLVGDASVWSDSGVLQDTWDHNNLTFGAFEQSWQTPDSTWPDQAGQTLKYECKPEYTYFAGQGAQAYTQNRSHDGYVTKASQQVAADYVRKLIFISPNTFVVCDRATIVNGSWQKVFHLHSINAPTVNDQAYSFDNGEYRVFGQSLMPSGATVASLPEDNGPGGAVSSYRIDVTAPTGNATDYFLNVMQIAPISQHSVIAPSLVTVTTGNMIGTLVNGWVVLFGDAETESGKVSYTIDSPRTTQQIVLDLEPTTTYAVSVGSSKTTAVTSAIGTLRFSAPAGHVVIVSLAPSGATRNVSITGP